MSSIGPAVQLQPHFWRRLLWAGKADTASLQTHAMRRGNNFALAVYLIAVWPCCVFGSQFDDDFDRVFPSDIPDLLPKSALEKSAALPKTTEQSLAMRETNIYTRYRIQGENIVPRERLDSIITPYLNRKLSQAELASLLDELTAVYIDKGYINSGVTLKKTQKPSTVLTLQTVTGRLSDIQVTNGGRLKDAYFSSRLRPAKGDAVNLNQLERRLQALKNDPRIDTVNAAFLPGVKPGDGVLQLNVDESRPWQFYSELNNYGSATVGEERLTLGFSHFNISGYGDQLDIFYLKNADRDGFGINYAMPFGRGDTRLSLGFSRSDTDFKLNRDLRLQTSADSVNVQLARVFSGGLANSHEIFAKLEFIKTESLVNDMLPTDIIAGDDGVSEVLALRVGHSWSWQALRRAFIVKTTLSYGENRSDENSFDTGAESENADFTGVHIQAQYAQRFSMLNSQLIIEGDLQKTDWRESPFPSEIFGIGGHDSLRGYRAGEIAANSGAFASLEWRIPGNEILGIMPRTSHISAFFDTAYIDEGPGSDADVGFQEFDSLSSYGIGFFWEFIDNASVELQWANGLQHGDNVSGLETQNVYAGISYVF